LRDIAPIGVLSVGAMVAGVVLQIRNERRRTRRSELDSKKEIRYGKLNNENCSHTKRQSNDKS